LQGTEPIECTVTVIYAAILMFCLPIQANAWDLQIVNNIDLVEVLE
jgi:hypothetical protein